MKDYSMCPEEKKAFILRYNITKDGKIIVYFADGEPWILPYNEKNEKILQAKMTVQVKEATDFARIKKREKVGCLRIAVLCAICSSIAAIYGILGAGITSQILLFITPIIASAGLVSIFNIIKNNSLLKDLRRNREFIAIQDTLNSNIRNNNNILANVSHKTKKVIEDYPEDRPIFNINSFNYISYSDLQEIVCNIRENELFGFDYTVQEQVKGKTKKRTRKK